MTIHSADSQDFDLLSPGDRRKLLSQVDRVYPPSVWLKLVKAFTLRGVDFFRFYTDLYKVRLGIPYEGNLRTDYKRAADRIAQIVSPYDKATLSPMAVNHIALTRPLINRVLLSISQGRVDDPLVWARFNAVFVPVLLEVAKDKGVFIQPTRQVGREQWAWFKPMSAKQERIERLRDEDPEAYALMVEKGKAIEEINRNIKSRILLEGKEVKSAFLAGRPVLLGVDLATGEESVYDLDGDIIPKSDYFDRVRSKTDAAASLSKVPTKTQVKPSEIRSLSNEELDRLTGDLEWASFTDDKAKQGRLTRILPTKWATKIVVESNGSTREQAYKVVVEGRYKGVFLDDLINSEGRLVEGTAFHFSVRGNKVSKIPQKMDPSEREPYVTVAKVVEEQMVGNRKHKVNVQKLYLKIDGSRQSAVLRNAIKKLACNTGTLRGCVPSIVYEAVSGSNAVGFYFEAKDFGLIMGSLQGMSLSKEALGMVQGYYTELARAETATRTLDAYSPDNLASESDSGEKFQFIKGSYNKKGEWLPFDLRHKQREALAWADANGNSGVLALETGVGKTVVSLGAMLKLVRDGLAETDATYNRPDGSAVTTNGRFLFVCPTSLTGNIRKEARDLLSDPKVILDRLDVLTYQQFSGASKSGKIPRSLQSIPFWKARKGMGPAKKKSSLHTAKAYQSTKAWDPALYTAIFFDEAQALKNPDTDRSIAALNLYHPRKICLTASPMERNPMEAYVLAAISNNTPLFGQSLTAQSNRQEMRRFKERFCEVVGGRIVGIKQDPLVQRDLHTWVKRNIFYADKTDVVEYKLPHPEQQVTPVYMPSEVESLYRDIAGQFSSIMQGAARKFTTRARGDSYTDTQAERIFSIELAPVIRLLTDMANQPAKALADISYAIQYGSLPGFEDEEGKPINLPRSFLQLIQKWRTQYQASEIRDLTATVGNPKLEAAEATLVSRLDSVQGSRALIFSDDRNVCLDAGMYLSKKLGGTHVVALSDGIHFFRSGSELGRWIYEIDPYVLERLHPDEEIQKAILAKTQGVVTHSLPFVKKSYKLYPPLRGKQGVNTTYVADEWQQFVLKEIVNPNPFITTCTLLGKVYMFGHNLQGFNTVIHLDRNAWNSESMKQRTARAWRQGQTQVVQETTLDLTYQPDVEGVERPEWDKTLDEIRAVFQAMDADLFDRIIKDAQRIALGAEWEQVAKKDASLWRLDNQVAELMSSPYLSRAKAPS